MTSNEYDFDILSLGFSMQKSKNLGAAVPFKGLLVRLLIKKIKTKMD